MPAYLSPKPSRETDPASADVASGSDSLVGSVNADTEGSEPAEISDPELAPILEADGASGSLSAASPSVSCSCSRAESSPDAVAREVGTLASGEEAEVVESSLAALPETAEASAAGSSPDAAAREVGTLASGDGPEAVEGSSVGALGAVRASAVESA